MDLARSTETRRPGGKRWREGAQRAEEEVICIRAPAANFEYLNQVVELSVDVADDGDGGAHVHHIALAHQQLLGLGAYCLDHRLGQEFLLVEARDALVEVHGGCDIGGVSGGCGDRASLAWCGAGHGTAG